MFNELKGLSKQLYLKYQVDELIKLYRNVQIGLSIKLRDVNLTSFQQYRAEQILKQVNEIITVLDRKVYKWAEKNIPIAYTQGIDLAAERLRALKVTRFVAYDAQVHTSAINILINDVASEMLITNTGMRKNIQRYLLQTQQQVLQEKEISSMIAEGLIGGETRREVSGKLLDEFRKKMNDKQFIVINGRNYRPDSYATLIARTRTVEASSQAILNTSLRYGVDLVQWDSHSEVCEYCQQFSGRVFSISGTDKDFPKLKEKPPLHPNCFLHHTVKIITDAGEKNINKIRIGDNVLTHKGRYRAVTNVLDIKKRYFGKAVIIKFKGRKNKYDTRNNITVTPEHPFLTNNGWKEADKLTLLDKLFVLAKYCKQCDKLIPYWKTYCSMECQLTPSTRKKISLSKMGKRNWMFGKTGNKHHLYNGGKIWYRGKDWDIIKSETKKRDGNKCLICGITEEEHNSIYGQPLQVHHKNPYRYSQDNSLDNLMTVCCACHRKIENTSNQEILQSGGAIFISIPIMNIQHINSFKGERLYNFSVEEDESYVAKGLVTHNCKCSITPITRTSLESRGYLNEVIKLSNAPSIKIDSFSRFEEVISQL